MPFSREEHTSHFELNWDFLEARLPQIFGEDVESYILFFLELQDLGWEEMQVRALFEMLMNNSERVDLASLGDLRKFSNRQQSLEVVRAQEQIRGFFDKDGTSARLRESGMYFFLHGSLAFGDPVNMDIDLKLIADSEDIFLPFKAEISKKSEQIDKYWQSLKFRGKRRGPGTVDFDSFDRIPQNVAEAAGRDQEAIMNGANVISFVLSGIPLYPQDVEATSMLQMRALGFAESHPLVCAIVNQDIRDSLVIRHQRSSTVSS